MEKKFIYIFMFIGSTVGGFIPTLWGAGVLSLSGLFFSFLGGLLGIYVGYKIGNSL